MMIIAWLAAQTVLLVAAVAVAGTGFVRLFASAALVIAGLALPWWVPDPAWLRALMACMGLLALLKSLQVTATPGRWRGGRRLWHAVAPFDIDPVQQVRPRLDAILLGQVALYAALCLVVLWLLQPRHAGVMPSFAPLRLVLGALLAYCGMEAITGTVRLVHLLAGLEVAPLQCVPIAARSVGEFWSRRWNRPVSGWLNQFIFVPVFRRAGPVLALIAAFAVSALLHAWMFLTAGGLRVALIAGLFFIVQAGLVLLEVPLRLARWPTPAQRAWTVGVLLVSSPLFTGPMLQVLGL